MGKIKIFVIYHKDGMLFSTDVLQPLRTGSINVGASPLCNSENPQVLRDCGGDNISDKNKNYGELSGSYWVWKNYLSGHPELEYVGFAHYRRFLDFQKEEEFDCGFCSKIEFSIFKSSYKANYTTETIEPIIDGYDVVLPKKFSCGKISVYNQYVASHPQIDIDKMQKIIEEDYPDYIEDMQKVLSGNEFYYCLNYVMKRELYEEWMEWIFDILFKLEKQSDWSDYTGYMTIRTPAYLAERFFNVWLEHKIRCNNIRVLERKSFILVKKKLSISFPLGTGSLLVDERGIFLNILGLKISKKMDLK